jgi:hypothetical protein
MKGPPWPTWNYEGSGHWCATYRREQIATIAPATGGRRQWHVIGVSNGFSDSVQEAIHAAGAAWRQHLQEQQPAASMPRNDRDQ